jgi:hypothetical protein
MSSPFTRMLSRLYPRHVRDRYGDELLELQDELRARGEISRVGLLRDAIVGAVLARSRRQRISTMLSLVALVAGLFLAGLMIVGSATLAPTHTPRTTPTGPIENAIVVPQLRPHSYQSCAVGDGSLCSVPACNEYVEMNPATGQFVAYGIEPANHRPAKATCAASRIRPASVLPVSKPPSADRAGG